MKKKLIILVLVLFMTIHIVGCGGIPFPGLPGDGDDGNTNPPGDNKLLGLLEIKKQIITFENNTNITVDWPIVLPFNELLGKAWVYFHVSSNDITLYQCWREDGDDTMYFMEPMIFDYTVSGNNITFLIDDDELIEINGTFTISGNKITVDVDDDMSFDFKNEFELDVIRTITEFTKVNESIMEDWVEF